MCNIKLKLSEGNRNVELDMVDYNDETLKFVMNKLMDAFHTPVQEESAEEKLKQGYQWHATDQEGLHDPGSEYSVPSTTQETKNELDNVKPLLQPSTTPVKATHLNVKEDGRKQLWYICGECNSKGKHYISASRTFVTCHECDHRMRVRFADSRGEGFQDEHGNYYIAGEYKKTLKDHEDELQFWKEYQTS
ncbi:hypothetical protein [Priestia megaterium]|uniref:hypothetical protein n=1 Tax=Priestia megaterium TaxID=1404 RepID=UPI000BFE7B0E|nr:hypothetical protein [Priestia megaterium]PGQ88363.1 hypothetical protein COA18_05380 [Priestia megaterium]